MKKVFIVIALVAVFGAYAFYQHNQNSNKNNLLTVNNSPTPAPVSNTPPPSPTPTPSGATPTPAPVTSGKFKDGEYTGAVADAFYGQIQVKAVIAGGKLTDIQFLQYPNERGETTQISNRSLPILKSEAITAQSSTVNAVSGATQTSEGFIQTLQSALDQAKA